MKYRYFFSISVIIGVFVFTWYQYTTPEHDHKLASGEELYNEHCADCHKKTGTGSFLKGVPANIATDKGISDLIQHIQQGSPSSRMPAFKSMSDQEAINIALYLQQLKQDYLSTHKNQMPLLTPRKH